MARATLAAQIRSPDLVYIERYQIHRWIMVGAVPPVAIQEPVHDMLRMGIFEIGAVLFTMTWTIVDNRKKKIFPLLLTALLCFMVSIAIFFIFTYPANKASLNWTQLPDDWQILQKNWEYSHAARAILNLVGFSFLIVTLLKDRKSSFR